jgi:hypothetical protein
MARNLLNLLHVTCAYKLATGGGVNMAQALEKKRSQMRKDMSKMWLAAMAAILAYLFYNSEYYYQMDFWSALLPVSYLITFALLITTR